MDPGAWHPLKKVVDAFVMTQWLQGTPMLRSAFGFDILIYIYTHKGTKVYECDDDDDDDDDDES